MNSDLFTRLDALFAKMEMPVLRPREEKPKGTRKVVKATIAVTTAPLQRPTAEDAEAFFSFRASAGKVPSLDPSTREARLDKDGNPILITDPVAYRNEMMGFLQKSPLVFNKMGDYGTMLVNAEAIAKALTRNYAPKQERDRGAGFVKGLPTCGQEVKEARGHILVLINYRNDAVRALSLLADKKGLEAKAIQANIREIDQEIKREQAKAYG